MGFDKHFLGENMFAQKRYYRFFWKPGDEGMTNRPSIFAYLVFGPGEAFVGGAARPVRAMIGCGPGATLGVQARIRGVQFVLVFG
jgi:hypothetical protein